MWLVWCFLSVVLISKLNPILFLRHHTGDKKFQGFRIGETFSASRLAHLKSRAPHLEVHAQTNLQSRQAHCSAALFSSLLCRSRSGLFIAAKDAFTEPLCREWLLLIKAHNNRTKTSKWVSLGLYIQSDCKHSSSHCPFIILKLIHLQACDHNYRKRAALCRLSNLPSSIWLLLIWQWLCGIGSHKEEDEITFADSGAAHASGSATIQKNGKEKL